MDSVRAQVDQQIHMLTCFHKWSIMSLRSRCMWVEYRLRKWRDKYGICVLERETKSCVAVYAEMPGVNKTHLQDIRTRRNLDTCFLVTTGGEEAFRLSASSARHVSLSLSISCPHYQPCGLFTFMSSYLYIIAHLFLLHAVSTWWERSSLSWERSFYWLNKTPSL